MTAPSVDLVCELRGLGLKQTTIAWLVGLSHPSVSRILAAHGIARTCVTTELPPEVRFWHYVREDSAGCWVWTGGRSKGYGAFHPKSGTSVRAHRFAYEQVVGEIPEGLHLDHLCRNPPCVNPFHLDPVPSAVNTRRGSVATKTACVKGHPYTPENTILRGPNRKHRQCRTCRDASNAHWNGLRAAQKRSAA